MSLGERRTGNKKWGIKDRMAYKYMHWNQTALDSKSSVAVPQIAPCPLRTPASSSVLGNNSLIHLIGLCWHKAQVL